MAASMNALNLRATKRLAMGIRDQTGLTVKTFVYRVLGYIPGQEIVQRHR